MMLDYDILGVEELLDFFNIEKTRDLVKEQLEMDDFAPGGKVTDHLQPLWARYNDVTELEDIKYTDKKEEFAKKFDAICMIFIEAVMNKYGLDYDEGWMQNLERSDIHGIAVMLYSFFVIDIENLILEVLIKFIDINIDTIATQFGENLKARKDAAYLSLKKSVAPSYAVVGASIFDICYWILDQMTENEFFDLIDGDYIPLEYVEKWFNDGHIEGKFMDKIYELFKVNGDMKARICYKIITNIRTRHPAQ